MVLMVVVGGNVGILCGEIAAPNQERTERTARVAARHAANGLSSWLPSIVTANSSVAAAGMLNQLIVGNGRREHEGGGSHGSPSGPCGMPCFHPRSNHGPLLRCSCGFVEGGSVSDSFSPQAKTVALLLQRPGHMILLRTVRLLLCADAVLSQQPHCCLSSRCSRSPPGHNPAVAVPPFPPFHFPFCHVHLAATQHYPETRALLFCNPSRLSYFRCISPTETLAEKCGGWLQRASTVPPDSTLCHCRHVNRQLNGAPAAAETLLASRCVCPDARCCSALWPQPPRPAPSRPKQHRRPIPNTKSRCVSVF